jgi:hypothetical protein
VSLPTFYSAIQIKMLLYGRGISNTPFQAHQEAKTLPNYLVPLVGLLAMQLRPKENYPVDLPADVTSQLKDLQQTLLQQNNQAIASKVLDVLLALWTRPWPKSEDGMLMDPTIQYIALSTLRQDGSFLEAKQVTGIFARFEWDMRCIFAVQIYRLVENKTYPTYEDAAESLEKWYTEKVEGTFNSIRSLQHRASAIAFATQGMPRIWWTDRKHHRALLYKGNLVTIENIQQVFANLEQAAVDVWEKDILLGLDLHVDFKNLADDLSAQDVHYSFLSDPRNKAFQDRERLARAILADPVQRGKFIQSATENGMPIWNIIALRTWLYRYSRLHIILLVRAEMVGGAPGRVTEFTALPYRNTKAQERALYAFDKYIGLLCRYHKGSTMTGQDKLIPHALDALTADLTIQDLAIARPFAELAIKIVYPDNRSFAKLYRDFLWINNTKLFDTNDVTNVMREFTRPVMGIDIGVSDWRHVQIAYNGKLCPRLGELIDLDRVDTVKALQACHSRSTEVRIYAKSQDSMAGLAEDVLPLFLDASTDWQVETETVPGGLALSYKDARSSKFKDLVKAGFIDGITDPSGQSVTTQKIVDGVVAQLKPILAITIAEQLQPLIATMVKESVAALSKDNPPISNDISMAEPQGERSIPSCSAV